MWSQFLHSINIVLRVLYKWMTGDIYLYVNRQEGVDRYRGVTRIFMRFFITTTLLMIGISALGQEGPHFSSLRLLPSSPFEGRKQKRLTFYPGTYVDTEMLYADSIGMTVIIQNSLPKGGGYTDLAGNKFGYGIFWTRVINVTNSPIEIAVHFPAAPLELANDFPSVGTAAFAVHPSSYLQLFLPSDTMTIEKETLYDYGANHLKSFLDAGLNKPTMMQRTISPGEACLFYIGVLLYQVSAATRGEIVLKDNDLFYRIKGISSEINDLLIPCGRIAFTVQSTPVNR